MNYFSVNYLEGAIEFLKSLESKTKEKVLSNAQKATLTNDPKLFKKLDGDIWELRTNHNGLQIRLLAFWDKTDFRNTLVVATHGFVKKKSKVDRSQIEKAEKIRNQYFGNST
jgi:phage-related protein